MDLTQGIVSVSRYAYQKERIRTEICVAEIARQYVQNHKDFVKVSLWPTLAMGLILALKKERIKMVLYVRVFVLQLVLRGRI